MKGKKGEMEKTYLSWHKRIEDVESKLAPILSESRTTETPSSYDFAPEEINNTLLFINKILSAEMASNPYPDSGQARTHPHLNQMVRKVQTLQSVLRDWAKVCPTSSSCMVSSEAPLYSYSDSSLVEHYDREEGYKLDHEEKEEFSPVGFKVYQNFEFVGDDGLDRLTNFEGLDDENKDQQEEEKAVRGGTNTEKRIEDAVKCSPDEQDEVGEFKGIEKEEISRVCDQKEKFIEKEEKGAEYDANTHCCFRVIFWGLLIGVGIMSMLAGFSDFPDFYSSSVFLTPT